VRREHDELAFTLAAADGDALALTRALADAGVGVRELVREQTTLEDLFFRLTESDAADREPEAAAA
jgi:hypothetical protein